MVQKSDSSRRGRPRKFDEHEVLVLARNAFWQSGYQATSMDILTEATGLNRPSLYGAFGDKHALFVRLMEEYRTANLAAAKQLLDAETSLRDALRATFKAAIGVYAGQNKAGRGCFVLGTAPSEALTDVAIRAQLAAITAGLDDLFEKRFHRALAEGDAVRVPDPKAAAQLTTAALHSLSVRARAGEQRQALLAMAMSFIALLAPQEPKA